MHGKRKTFTWRNISTLLLWYSIISQFISVWRVVYLNDDVLEVKRVLNYDLPMHHPRNGGCVCPLTWSSFITLVCVLLFGQLHHETHPPTQMENNKPLHLTVIMIELSITNSFVKMFSAYTVHLCNLYAICFVENNAWVQERQFCVKHFSYNTQKCHFCAT